MTDFVYGYGSTKHIRDVDSSNAHRHGEWGLCGAPGGHPLVRDSLPVCKRCEKQLAKRTAVLPLNRSEDA